MAGKSPRSLTKRQFFSTGVLVATGGLLMATLFVSQTLQPWLAGVEMSVSLAWGLCELLFALGAVVLGFALMVLGSSPLETVFPGAEEDLVPANRTPDRE